MKRAPLLSFRVHIVHCTLSPVSQTRQPRQPTRHPLTNDPFLNLGLTRRLRPVGGGYKRSYGYQTRTVRGHRHINQSHVAKMIRVQDLTIIINVFSDVAGLCPVTNDAHPSLWILDPYQIINIVSQQPSRYPHTNFTTSLPSTERIAIYCP